MENVISRIMQVFVCLLFVLVFLAIGYAFYSAYKHNNRPCGIRTAAMSPAQCKAAGGCSVEFAPARACDLYSDGTSPKDYK